MMTRPDVPVSDPLLKRLIAVAHAARDGAADEAGAILMLGCAPECLEELLRYRLLLGARFRAAAACENVAPLKQSPRLRLVTPGAGPDLGGAA